MAPAELAGLVVDGLEDSLSPDAVIRARPSVDAIGWLGKVNAPARMSVDNKKPVSCVETWGPKTRRAQSGVRPALVPCPDWESDGPPYRSQATSSRDRMERSKDSSHSYGQAQ